MKSEELCEMLVEINNDNISLEYDIKNSFISKKIKNSEVYAQNIYAALCNNIFYKNEEWSCSWRYAGGMVSEILGKGNYLDWYCSGTFDIDGYLSEGTISDEILSDFSNIGWKKR